MRRRGFLYLMAIMDSYSRYVMAWRLSNTLDGTFYRDARDKALAQARPEIFSSDQGSQFTTASTTHPEPCGVAIRWTCRTSSAPDRTKAATRRKTSTSLALLERPLA